MRSTVLLYISLIILSALAGCSSPTHRELLRAESVMSHDPALALGILDSLSDAPSLATDRNSRFLYNLLLTEARYKNYLPFEGDSLIILTTEYYRKKGDRNRLMRILYLKGRCEFENTEYSKSAVSAQKVLKLASSIGDTLFMAKAEELLSDIYVFSYNSKEELIHAYKAAELYKAAGKMDNYLFSLVDKARALENNHLSSASISLLDSILTLTQTTDTVLRLYIEESKIHPLISMGKAYEADRLLDSIMKIPSKSSIYIFPPTDMLKVALAVKDHDRVRRGIDSLLRSDITMLSDMAFLNVAYDYYKELNNTDSTLKYSELINNKKNEITSSALRHGVAIAQMDYFSAEAENEKRHSEFIFLIASFIIFGILLITIISVLYFRNMMLRKSIEKAELLDKISGLIVELGDNEVRLKEISEEKEHLISSQNRDIVEKEEEIRRLSDELALLKDALDNSRSDNSLPDHDEEKTKQIFKERFSVINKLCEKYYTYKDITSDNKSLYYLYRGIEQLISGFGSDNFFSQIERFVDTHKFSLASRIRVEFPKMSKTDYRFIVLTFAEFSHQAICLICDIKQTNYYNYRNRIKKMLEQSSDSNRIDFLNNFAKQSSKRS